MQTRLESLLEAKVNLAVGFGIAWFTNVYLAPWLLGVHMSGKQGFGMVVLFSVLSLIRQYTLRRVFETMGRRRKGTQ